MPAHWPGLIFPDVCVSQISLNNVHLQYDDADCAHSFKTLYSTLIHLEKRQTQWLLKVHRDSLHQPQKGEQLEPPITQLADMMDALNNVGTTVNNAWCEEGARAAR